MTAMAALAALIACKGKDDSESLRSAVAGPASLRDVVRLTGSVLPADSVELKSQVSAEIKKILIKQGDFVKKGQLLIDLDRVQLELTHEKLVIAVKTADVNLKSAERDLARGQSQLPTGSVSSDHVQDLVFARDRAKLALESAQIDLKNNDQDIAYTRIVAPCDGQVIRLPVTVGEMAVGAATSSSGGNDLAILADPAHLKVVVEVSELDYPRLKLGQRVEISTEADPDKLQAGHVSFIPPSASPSTSNTSVQVFPVEVTLDQDVPAISLTEVAAGSHRWGGWSGKPGAGRDSARAGKWSHGGKDSAKGGGGWKHGGKDTAAGGRRHSHGGNRNDSLNTKLVPGMTVNVDFVFLERKVDIAVPYDLVKTSPDGARKVVRIRGDKGLRPKPVQVGVTDFRSIEILDGLSAGDTVWAEPDNSSGKQSRQGGGPPR
jgi:RND family efflux transporter MFP subunit